MIRTLYLVSQERPLSGVILSQVASLLHHMTDRLSSEVSLKVAYQLPLIDVRRKGIFYTAKEVEYFRREAGLPKERFIRLPTMVPTSSFYMTKIVAHGLLPGIWKLRRILEAGDFNLIHARGYPAILVALGAIKHMSRCPKLIFDMRGLYPLEGVVLGRFSRGSNSFAFWKQIEEEAFGRSDAVFTLSHEMSKYVMKLGGNPIEIAPSVRVEPLSRVGSGPKIRHELGIDQNALVFAFSGTLGTWHSIDNLLRVYHRLKGHLAKLLPDRPIVLLIVSPSGIQKSILSKGNIIKMSGPPQEVIEILQCADIGLVPLRDDERFQNELDEIARTMGPSKVAEYLASGLMVVSDRRATAVSRFIEQNRVGLSYDVGRESEISERLIRILDDSNFRQNAKAIGESVFGSSRVLEQIVLAYKEVLK